MLGWIYIAASSGLRYMVIGLGTVAAGSAIYLTKAKYGQEWPFETI